MFRFILIGFVIIGLMPLASNAQTDSIGKLSLSGYLEVYATRDINATPTNERPGFFFNYRRTNEVAVNLAYLKAYYETNRTRMSLGLMAGNYVQYNMASEPPTLRPLYEAYAGVKLSTTKDIWLDAGVLPSHIGMESPEGKNQWTLTRSLAGETTPYYETGLRLLYRTQNKHWLMGLYVLNGWQHIQRIEANSTPSFGTQLTYTPSDKFLVNYSTFIGNEFPDSAQQWRYFNNLYSVFSLSERWSMNVGFDIGFEQRAPSSATYNIWYTPYMNLRYQFATKWFACVRGEYYSDRNQVIAKTKTSNGFQTLGYSLNVDCAITSKAMWRIEYRGFNSKDAIFYGTTDKTQSNFYNGFTTCLAFSF
jgi:hypothetical protein